MRPDREKLLAVSDAVAEIEVPAVSDDAAAVQQEVIEIIEKAAREIREAVNNGLPVPKKAKRQKQIASR